MSGTPQSRTLSDLEDLAVASAVPAPAGQDRAQA